MAAEAWGVPEAIRLEAIRDLAPLRQGEAPALPGQNATASRSARAIWTLCAATALASIPSVLLVRDQWFGDRAASRAFQTLWAKIPFLQRLEWPPYFIAVLLSYLGLLFLLALRRRDPCPWTPGPPPLKGAGRGRSRVGQLPIGHALVLCSGAVLLWLLYRAVVLGVLPGWELLVVILVYTAGKLLCETRAAALIRLWRRKIPVAATLIAAHLSLIGLLTSHFVARRLSWISLAVLAGATLLLLLQRRRVRPSTWIVLLAILLGALCFDAWWFSPIGDEVGFWRTARDIVRNQSAKEIGSHLFLLKGGVYGTHPYFSSLVHAAGMALAGVNNLGWKLSNVYLSALAIAFFFRFYRTFVGGPVALLAVFFLAGSHYVLSFAKVGYNNLQAYFAMALVLAAAAWAVRTRRPFAFACLGLAMAGCLYVYPAALYILPLPVVLLLLYDPPNSRPAIARWATLGVAMLIPFPWLLQPEFFLRLIPGTFAGDRELLQSGSRMLFHLASNFSYAALAPLYNPGESHFVGISTADPLTAALIAIGVAVTLRRIPRDRFALFLILGWVILLFLAGASHGGGKPLTTRMFLLLPWYALSAAIGLGWLVQRARSVGWSRQATWGVTAAVVLLMIGLNLCQAFILSPRKMIDYQSFDAVFHRVARKIQEAVPRGRIVILTRDKTLESGTLPWTTKYGLAIQREVYGLPPLSDLKVETGGLSEQARRTLRDPDVIVFFRPEMKEEGRRPLERVLGELGKIPCPARNMGGGVRLVAWQSPDLPRFCE